MSKIINPNSVVSRRQKAKTNDLINKFVNERNQPHWYRGLSNFQLAAADNMLSSIRDDSEQGTSHRIRRDLIILGVVPIVSGRKIKLAMRLSRGNDLAFLWFLMELYYRPKRKKGEEIRNYTVNEQLIMCAIAHLDTIPTLRELNQILPKYKPKPKKEPPSPRKGPKIDYILPYFEKQRLPVKYGKKLTLQVVDKIAKMGRYDAYVNPNDIIPSECTRWFETYKLKSHERVAKGILDDSINNAVEKAETGKFNDVDPIFCAQHMALKALKAQMLDEIEVARARAYEKCFDHDGRMKDKSYKRVVEMLDKLIEDTQNDFQRLEKNINRGLMPHIIEEESLSIPVSKGGGGIPSALDYGHAAPTDGENKYFQGPSPHTPYKFNYEKIFDIAPKDPIKEAVQSALNGESTSEVSLENTRAVKKCCKEMWKEQLEKYKAECARELREKKKRPKPKEELNFPKSEDIDPKDKDQIHAILQIGLNELKKNRKYVLASLPDSYKVPVLRVWARKRYGWAFKRDEKRKSFYESKKIFTAMNQGNVKVRLPTLDDVAENREISYSCQKYLYNKSMYLRNKYLRNFKTKFLEIARVYWGAVRPYQCSGGPPRNEFFSYLPSRENDIHMFRPWRKNEYIRAKEQWDRRQYLKRQENKFY